MNQHDQHRDHRDGDDRLHAHLRAADPAAHLAPTDPATLAALARDAMQASPGRIAPVSDVRRRAPQLLAAAAAVVVVVAGGWALLGPEDPGPTVALDPAPAASSAPAPAPSAPSGSGTQTPGPGGAGADTATVLRVPATATARCAVPTADTLRGQDVAFAGTVTALEGDLAVLDASRVYAGEVSDVVRVQAPSVEMSMLLSGVQFEVGSSYLVSATGGQVSLCGLSAEASPELRALYAEAYGR